MTPFQVNHAALFVPRDSPISRVELLARDMRQHYRDGKDKSKRDERSNNQPTELEHGLGKGKTQGALAEAPTTPTKLAKSRTLEPNSVSLHWVPLTSQKEIESNLNVWTSPLDLGSQCWLTILSSKEDQQFRVL